ncbi:hypothetical protein [Streptomyces sp. NPDC086766]
MPTTPTGRDGFGVGKPRMRRAVTTPAGGDDPGEPRGAEDRDADTGGVR